MQLQKMIHAKIVTPQGIVEGGLLYETGGRILAVGELPDVAAQTIDAGGAWAVPGGVDPHVHLGGFGKIPIADDFYQGSLGALAGGTTTVIDFCEPKAGESARHCIEQRMREASISAVDYAFHFVLTEDYATLLQDLAYIESMGIRDYKLFTIYDNTTLSLDDIAFIFERLRGDPERTFLIHAEDARMIGVRQAQVQTETDFRNLAWTRPPQAEANVAAALQKLAAKMGVRVCIAHVSAKETAALLDAPAAGGEFQMETCPHYLAFTEEKLAGKEGALYTMTPPLRQKADCDALWHQILAGKLGILSTDHCPYRRADKMGRTYRTVPCGVDGIQTRMLYLYSEGVRKRGLSMRDFVRLTSENAARFYGLYPRKGCLAPGSDADIVLLSPIGETKAGVGQAQDAIDYTIYDGMAFAGRIDRVLKAGRTVFADGAVQAPRGSGVYLKGGKGKTDAIF